MAKRKAKRRSKPKARQSKKTQRPVRRQRGVLPYFYVTMAKIYDLLEQKEWLSARKELLSLHEDYPSNLEVLENLVNVHYELKDIQSYQIYCEKLLQYDPNNPDLVYGLAGAYFTNGYPGLALEGFQDYLRRYPDHDHVDKACEGIDRIEKGMGDDLKIFEAYGDPVKIAADHDRVRYHAERGNYQQVRSIANRLLKLNPSFIPVLNNLSIAELTEGKLKQATSYIEKVLSLEPDNFQARANMVRCYAMQGQLETAQKEAEKLKAIQDENEAYSDIWAKKAEAFSLIGDDQAVLETFNQAFEAGYIHRYSIDASLYHFAAVSTFRLGDEKRAIELWLKALELMPDFSIVKSNLADLEKPVAERYVPWAFETNGLLSQPISSEIKSAFGIAEPRSNEEISRDLRKIIKKHPHITNLLPILLDRGDLLSRVFALNVIIVVESEPMLACLPAFALGKYGPDEMRHKALRLAIQHNLLPNKNMVWIEGKQQELKFFNFRISDEPKYDHSPEVAELARKATEKLYDGDGVTAEQLLKQAIQLSPNTPNLRNNLALAYSLQGLNDKSKEIIEKLHQDYPDYLFGQVAMSGYYVAQGDFEKAEALLLRLIDREKYHPNEFEALAGGLIKLYLAKRELEPAEYWLNICESVMPELPELETWKKDIEAFKAFRKASTRIRRRQSTERARKKLAKKLFGL